MHDDCLVYAVDIFYQLANLLISVIVHFFNTARLVAFSCPSDIIMLQA